MSQVRQEQPSMLARAEEIQTQIHELSSRDMQLWSIVSLVILVLTAGFLALLAPNLVWTQRVVKIRQGISTIVFRADLPGGVVQHLPAVTAGVTQLHSQGSDQRAGFERTIGKPVAD